MEPFIAMFAAFAVLCVIGWTWNALTSKSPRESGPDAVPAPAPVAPTPAAPQPQPVPVFERMETVTVSRPEDLAEAIARVSRDRTNNVFNTNYVLGTPQITADGLTANIPLYRAS